MGHRAIRTAIKAVLGTIPNIGVIHDYERQTADPTTFLSWFRSSDTATPDEHYLQGWTISEEAIDDELMDVGGTTGNNLVTHRMVIKGYRSLDDSGASELTFLDLIESVQAKLRADVIGTALDGVVLGTSGPMQVRRLAYWVLGDILCHYAELTYDAVELIRR